MDLSDGLTVLRISKEDVESNVESDGSTFSTQKSKKEIGPTKNRISSLTK